MKKKILIVDDEKEIVEFLERGLIKEGFDTVSAFDGQQAKEKILAENPDVILLDLLMPKLDGWAVLRWLREEAKLLTPTIILSAKEDLTDMKRSYNLEADTYLVKPVSVTDVVSGIHLVSALGREREEIN